MSRDQPENLLLDANMSLKVTDFGLSTVYFGRPSLHTRCGSYEYSAPELIGSKPYHGPEVDMYTLGVNLFVMLMGELPFPSESISKLYAMQLKEQYKLSDTLSPSCRDMIKRLLCPSPSSRATIDEIRRHPWLNEGLDMLRADIYDANAAVEVNGQIVDQVVRLQVGSVCDVEASVKGRRLDRLFACYRIFEVCALTPM
jgi:serine/threonine protein kinase